jgi:hypothetical protein
MIRSPGLSQPHDRQRYAGCGEAIPSSNQLCPSTGVARRKPHNVVCLQCGKEGLRNGNSAGKVIGANKHCRGFGAWQFNIIYRKHGRKRSGTGGEQIASDHIAIIFNQITELLTVVST